VTWEALLDYDWPRQPHPALVALALAKAALLRIPEGEVSSEDPRASVWTLGAAMLAALAKQTAPLTEADAGRGIGDDEMFVGDCLIELVCGLDAISDPVDGESIWGAWFGMIGAQHSVQADIGTSLVRARAILGLGMFADPGSQETDDLIRTHYGADLATACALLMVLPTRLRTHPAFHVGRELRGSPRRDELAPIFAKMMRGMSREAVDVRRTVLEDMRGLRGLYTVTCAFWQRFPAVHLGSGHYLLAPYRLVAAQLGFGLVLHVMRLALEKYGRRDNPVTVAMGNRFQRYVHRVLSELADHEVVDEHEFIRGGSERSADHLVFDPDGRCVTVVEDKLARLSYRTFFGHGLSALEHDITRWIAPSLRQAFVYLHRAQTAGERRRLAAAREDISRRVVACEAINIVVVVPAFPPIAHAQQIRDRIAAILSDEIESWAREHSRAGVGLAVWYSRLRSDRRVAWHVLEVEDLENFVAYRARGQALGGTIRRYLDAVAGKPPIDGTRFLKGFGEYVRSSMQHAKSRIPDLIASAFNEAVDESNRILFGRGAPASSLVPRPRT